MKVNSVDIGVNIIPKQTNFKSQNSQHVQRNGHDEFVNQNNERRNRVLRFLGGLSLVGMGILLLHLTKKKPPKGSSIISEFKNVNQAKEYLEKMGIETDLRGANDEHLALLDRIKENLKQLNEMGVKKEKPDSITISDWSNAIEYEELCKNHGINIERREGYWAFCGVDRNGKTHVYINNKHPEFSKFLHEMGHANHFTAEDSFWHAKGVVGQDFADKQLEVLGSIDKTYRNGQVGNSKLSNIFNQFVIESPSKFIIPNSEGEVRYIYAQNMVNKMHSETNCYDGGKHLTEEVADIFEGLMNGKEYSDEVMLYYDFSGGARIPNLKISGKTYDEYIESLYNNKELIQKLRENVKISKI